MLSSGDFSGLAGLFHKGALPSEAPPARGEAPATADDKRQKWADLAQSGLASMATPNAQAAPAMAIAPGHLGTLSPAYAQANPGLQSLVSPLHMAKGGIAAHGNDKQITSAAIAAIQGQHPDPQMALGVYLKRHGPTALRELVDKVHSGTPLIQNGRVSGPGDGMSDNVPAQGPGASDILLADGEYVVPADVVSGLGNGSTDAGARRLKEMEATVRQARTGNTKQPEAMDPSKALPA